MMSVKTKPKTTEPTRLTLEDFPDYVDARDRLEALRLNRSRLGAELLTRVAEANFRGPGKIDEAAERLAADPDGSAVPCTPAAKRYDELEGELRILDRAIEIAQQRVQAAWISASAEIVAGRRGEHVELVAQIAEQLEKLVAAVRSEQSWFDQLRKVDKLHVTGAGAGGTCNPVTSGTRELFRLLRGLNLDAWRDHLVKARYLPSPSSKGIFR